jgi:predicted CxxxxCH...CXXCH cytochrome family protein
MSQVMKISMTGLLLIIGLAFLGGCGSSTPNSQAVVNGEGQHAADWLPAGHMIAAREDQAVCTECHGSDYLGGIARVSCTSCHLGGVDSLHPTDWGPNTTTLHGAYVDSNGATGCANASCHGTTLGGVTGSGPACTSCHVKGSPLTLTGCTSCHANPPSGTVYPDVKGAHSPHNALANVTSVCNACHSGAGTGTLNHDNGVVDVAFLTGYNAKSGTAVRNADGTCSKVSCHGGQTTPGWYSGTSIDVNTQCTSCHTYGTAEFNSFVSGQHALHVNGEGIDCVACHDTSKLGLGSNHFNYLNTSAMEGPASATLNGSLHYTGGTCTPTCHSTDSW